MEYALTVNQQQQQPKFPQLDSGLTVPVFKQGDGPIDAINHMISFLSVVVTSRYPTTNNQLRNSSNPRQQATINDGRVTLQPTQGRQISFATGTTRTYTPGASGSNYGKQRTVICYNCKGEGHMSKQCTKPKRKRDDSWFKDKVLLVHNGNYAKCCSEFNLLCITRYNDIICDRTTEKPSNYTKINLDNKSVNDTITAELERYKEQSVNIDRLKQTLSEHLKEKESLMQTVTLLKNDFKKEESRNNDREIDLEKKIKQLDNIVYKRDQSAQTLEPKLYDGNVIKNTSAIVIPDSEETLMLAEESRSKMLIKQQDPMVLEKKLSAEQAFWSKNSMNSLDPSPSCRPTKVEVPKELPKVSMCLKLKTELLNKKDLIKKETYDKLFRSYITLEKHCISLEVDTLLNQEIFQRDNSVSNQSAPNFDQYFELNELKAQSQEKDTVIKKLKERIKSLSGNMNKDKVEKDIEVIETINIELDHRVSKLIAENEQLKQTYKQLYDSIKLTRIRSKEQCDALINQVNQKSVEISDLNVSLQEKDLVITTLKDELRKLKVKDLADNVVTKYTIAPKMLKIDVELISPRLFEQ
ncbi:retrovirus-related pol polyprotein from transposon TNT 1-94 [Tanacetum coccineum]